VESFREKGERDITGLNYRSELRHANLL
jgi:hypothetical protein